jgi:hypothetical protein
MPQRRTRVCHYWLPAECQPQRTRSRFSPPPSPDPCLGARRLSGRVSRSD